LESRPFQYEGGASTGYNGTFYRSSTEFRTSKKDLEEGEGRKKEQDEQSPYSKQKWGKEPTPEWTLFKRVHSFGGLGA
jgi:hypothetical protein